MNLKKILEDNLIIDKNSNFLFYGNKINTSKKFQHNLNKSEIINLILKEYDHVYHGKNQFYDEIEQIKIILKNEKN